MKFFTNNVRSNTLAGPAVCDICTFVFDVVGTGSAYKTVIYRMVKQ